MAQATILRVPRPKLLLLGWGFCWSHITSKRDLCTCVLQARRGINNTEDRVFVSLMAAPVRASDVLRQVSG